MTITTSRPVKPLSIEGDKAEYEAETFAGAIGNEWLYKERVKKDKGKST